VREVNIDIWLSYRFSVKLCVFRYCKHCQ